MARSFLPDSSRCPSILPMEDSSTVRYMIRGLPGVGGKHRRIFEVMLDLIKGLLAIFGPLGGGILF